MGCHPGLPQCFANLRSILSRVSHVSGWDDLAVGVLFPWARRFSRSSSLHNDVFVRSIARVRPSIIQGRQAEQAVAPMDCDIRCIHHIRGHGMVSTDGMVLRRHLSRAARPVPGSTPLRSVRNSSWDSSCQNKPIRLCRSSLRRYFRAPPVRVSLVAPLSILRQEPSVSDHSLVGILRSDRRSTGTRYPQKTRCRPIEAFQSEIGRHPPCWSRCGPSLFVVDPRIISVLGPERPLRHKHFSGSRTADTWSPHLSVRRRLLQLHPVQDLLCSDRSKLHQGGLESASPKQFPDGRNGSPITQLLH